MGSLQGIRVASFDCRIALWGDSLTAQVAPNGQTGYGLQLEGLMPTRIITIQGVGGDTTAQILTRHNADTAHRAWVNVIWGGRNDFGSFPASTLVANIQSMLTYSDIPRFVVLSVHNGDGEGIGTGNYTTIQTLNAAYQAAWPNNYLDIRDPLIAAYNPGIPQDVTDHSNDLVPSSLRSDAVHLTTAGYGIVASLVQGFIVSKGW